VLVVLRVTHVSIVISIDVRGVTEDVDGAAGVAGAQGRAYVERTNAPERRPEERRSMSAFPRSHVNLLDGPLPAVLTTEMPNGRFQSTVVWFNRRRRSHPLLGGPLDGPLG